MSGAQRTRRAPARTFKVVLTFHVKPDASRSEELRAEAPAAGTGSCHCGAPYEPASKRAAEGIKASPGKSDRAIAAEIGVSQPTVSKARKELAATDNSLSVQPRTGLDG